VLDEGERLAGEKTGGTHDQHIDEARDLAARSPGSIDPSAAGCP
jgi:hypothetical protein